jgi:molybdopterin converting factor subunit 1
MDITVRFFASYADRLGIRDTRLTLGEAATVMDVLSKVAALPGGDHLPKDPLVAVNQVYATADTLLESGDEVALIPPVAGG